MNDNHPIVLEMDYRVVPCEQCRASKIKCNHQYPCSSCIARGRQCHYSEADGSGRQRKYHKRSRNGCLKCKERRVRCDEARPCCGACARMKLQSQCIYADKNDLGPVRRPGARHTGGQPVHTMVDTAHTANAVNSSVINTPVSNTPVASSSVSPENDVGYMLGAMIANTAYKIPQETQLALPPPPPPPSQQEVYNYIPQFPQASVQELPQIPSTSVVPMDFVYAPEPQSQSQQQALDWPVPDNTMAPLDYIPTGYELQPPPPIHQPDLLALFFPSVEQRQSYRHFFTETVKSLVVIQTSPSTNPWLTRLSSMAIGTAPGHDLYQDALRSAILSLSSFDIGFRIHHTLSEQTENAMYRQSWEQRCGALSRLKMCAVMDMKVHEADLALGTILALSFRDRLSGSQEWEEPLQLASTIITSAGGPEAFIANSPTPIRRYLVEQLACAEIVASLSTFALVGMLKWDCSWLEVDPVNEPNDHLHIVYGWDRGTIKLAGQVVVLAKEYRQAMILKAHNARHQYHQVSDAVSERLQGINARALELLEAAPITRQNLMMMPVPDAVTLMALAIIASVELAIRIIVMENYDAPPIQAGVKTIIEVSDEALVRGMHTGLLLPLTWAAACASGQTARTIVGLLERIQERYHLEHGLMSRLVHFPWKDLNDVEHESWNTFFRERGVYVPIF